MGRIVNQHELSVIMDVSQKSLSAWQKDEGMPVELETENGLSNQYDTAKVIAWYVAREKARGLRESEKDRLSRLQGDKIEIELAQLRGELVPVADIEPTWTAKVMAAREAFLSLPTRLAPTLAQITDIDASRDLLEEEIEAALQKLSYGDDERTEEHVEASGPTLATADEGAAVALGGAAPEDAARVRGTGGFPLHADAVPA